MVLMAPRDQEVRVVLLLRHSQKDLLVHLNRLILEDPLVLTDHSDLVVLADLEVLPALAIQMIPELLVRPHFPEIQVSLDFLPDQKRLEVLVHQEPLSPRGYWILEYPDVQKAP